MKLNLNLLRIFVAVYETGHVTRAAELLGMSQPAASAALARLAAHFDQPLFERVVNGVKPTVLADELIEPVRAGLHTIEAGLEDFPDSVSDNRARHFRISMFNLAEPSIFTPVLDQLWREMPGVTLEIVQGTEIDALEELSSGSIDLAYHLGSVDHPDLNSEYLVDGIWAAITRKGWTDDFGPLDQKAYEGARIILMDKETVQVESPVSEAGANKSIVPACEVSRGWSIPHMVKNSDMVAMVPRAFGIFVANRFDLQLHQPPSDVAPSDVRMVWHKRLDENPFHRRLREIAAYSVAEITRRIRSGQRPDEGLFVNVWPKA